MQSNRYGPLCGQDVKETTFDIINLSFYILSDTEKELLLLGLSFCPVSPMDKFTIIKGTHIFACRLLFCVKYDHVNEANDPTQASLDDFDFSQYSKLDFRILWDLTDLLRESGTDEVDLIDHLNPE